MIDTAGVADLDGMLDLSEARRKGYARYHPIFHRPAENARERQEPYFRSLLSNPDFIVLVERIDSHVSGLVVGHVIEGPPVYDPGGLTCIVDDFAVEKPDLWPTVGAGLLGELRRQARSRGAVQVIVVVAPEDDAKRAFLLGSGLRVVSEWLVGPLAAS